MINNINKGSSRDVRILLVGDRKSQNIYTSNIDKFQRKLSN